MTIGDLMDKREEIGYARGYARALTDLLYDLGDPPAEILERVKTLDNDTLKTWTKLAARAESMEEFLAQIG